MADEPENSTPHRQLYGRRRGRPLRTRQRELLDELLPRLSFSLPAATGFDPQTLFAGSRREIWLEIGFGAGEHLAAVAEQRPAIGLIGCEVYQNGVAKLLGEVSRRGLANVRLFTDDARLLVAALPAASIGRVFILFPDPWPKARHRKRRLVSREMLDALARIMTAGAELRLATDDRDYFTLMLEQVTGHRAFEWLARSPADWRERPPDWPPTRYEEKARAAGRSPAFLRARNR